jgi:hypothetical protein
MPSALRLILALAVLLQPLHALTVQGCGLPARAGPAAAMPTSCHCCDLGTVIAPCPVAPPVDRVCGCLEPLPDSPSPLPVESRADLAKQWTVLAPLLIEAALPVAPAQPSIAATPPPRWGGTHSIHQLLCRWVT